MFCQVLSKNAKKRIMSDIITNLKVPRRFLQSIANETKAKQILETVKNPLVHDDSVLLAPFNKDFAVDYTPKEMKEIQKKMDQINQTDSNRLILKKTDAEIASKTEICKSPLSKKLKQSMKQILKQLNYPYGWTEFSKIAPKFAQTLYFISKPNWTKFNSIQYFANESILSYFVVRRILSELRRKAPSSKIRTVLDFGAGTGSATTAAKEIFGETITSINAVENNFNMAQIGRRFASESNTSREAQSKTKNVFWHETLEKENLTGHNLTIASFVLSELEETQRDFTLEKLWRRTKDFLVLVEGGEPKGGKIIQDARDYLLRSHPPSLVDSTDGASTIAPCPNDLECPMNRFAKVKKRLDWCHFAQMVPVQNIPEESSLFVSKWVVDRRDEKSAGIKGEENVPQGDKSVPQGGTRFVEPHMLNHIFRFSYVVLRKGKSARRALDESLQRSKLRGNPSVDPSAVDESVSDTKMLQWPRVVDPPMKRRKHVILRLCHEGDMKRIVVTKLNGRREYAFARHIRWGDQWPFSLERPESAKREHRLKFKRLKEIKKLQSLKAADGKKAAEEVLKVEKAKETNLVEVSD